MELGIGAGWAREEYQMVGIPFDPGPTRAARFEEAVGIDPAEFSTEAFSDKVAVLDDCVHELGAPGPERGVLLFSAGATERMVDTLVERRERWG